MLDEPACLLVAECEIQPRGEPALVLCTVDSLLVGAEHGAELERDRLGRRGITLDPILFADPGILLPEFRQGRTRERGDLNRQFPRLSEEIADLNPETVPDEDLELPSREGVRLADADLDLLLRERVPIEVLAELREQRETLLNRNRHGILPAAGI